MVFFRYKILAAKFVMLLQLAEVSVSLLLYLYFHHKPVWGKLMYLYPTEKRSLTGFNKNE
jgi:hypothetical protein